MQKFPSLHDRSTGLLGRQHPKPIDLFMAKTLTKLGDARYGLVAAYPIGAIAEEALKAHKFI